MSFRYFYGFPVVLTYKSEHVLGLNIDSTNQDNITQLLAADEWKHVKLFKIEKENGSFSLTKKELV